MLLELDAADENEVAVEVVVVVTVVELLPWPDEVPPTVEVPLLELPLLLPPLLIDPEELELVPPSGEDVLPQPIAAAIAATKTHRNPRIATPLVQRGSS